MTKSSEPQRILVPRSWTQRAPRRTVFVALGSLLAFDLLFYLILVFPLGAREQDQALRLGALQRQAQAKTEEVAKLEIILEKVAKARGEGDGLLEDITLERRSTFSTLLLELQQAATDSGVETRETSYEVEPIDGAEQYGMVHISANYRARYDNLVKFLNRLDRSEKFLIIGSLGATPRAETDELQVTLRFDTFVRNL